MVTYADFNTFSPNTLTETEFPVYERSAVDVLAILCGDTWSETDATCIKAVKYQIEYMVQQGGFEDWSNGKGAVSSKSYSIGGESESITYMQGESNGKAYNGLAISPIAYGLLKRAEILKVATAVRVD